MPTLSSAPLTATVNIGSTGDGNALARSASDISPVEALHAIQGAQGYLDLYFAADAGPVGATPINQQLASGVELTFTGKVADDLDATSLLFQASAFVEKTDAADRYFYRAFLDLDRDEIATAFSATDASTLDCAVDIQMKIAAAGATPSLLGIYRIAMRLLRQVYFGTESNPSPATPAYPTAAVVTSLLNLFAAGMLLLAPQACDFRQSRNAQFAANL